MKLIENIAPAWQRMVGQLFTPFDLKRWFLLGFSAFLASLFGGGSSFNFRRIYSSEKGKPAFYDTWGPELWFIVIGIALVMFLVLFILFMWLGSRGQFMLIDNVVKGTAEVRAPWREYQALAWKLFVFWIQIFSGAFVALFVIGGACAVCYFLIPASGRTWVHFIPLGLGFLVLFTFFVVFGIVMFFLREFGVLWMYRHGGTAEAAAHKVFQLARDNPADFLCYLLIRLVMGIVFFIISLLLGLLTCCLGFLPYLRSVTNLPLTVFRVWYSIECFAQLGPDCDVRSENPPPIPLIEPPPIGP